MFIVGNVMWPNSSNTITYRAYTLHTYNMNKGIKQMKEWFNTCKDGHIFEIYVYNDDDEPLFYSSYVADSNFGSVQIEEDVCILYTNKPEEYCYADRQRNKKEM